MLVPDWHVVRLRFVSDFLCSDRWRRSLNFNRNHTSTSSLVFRHLYHRRSSNCLQAWSWRFSNLLRISIQGMMKFIIKGGVGWGLRPFNYRDWTLQKDIILTNTAALSTRNLSLFLSWWCVLNDPRMIFYCWQFHSLSGILHKEPMKILIQDARSPKELSNLPIKSRAPFVT